MLARRSRNGALVLLGAVLFVACGLSDRDAEAASPPTSEPPPALEEQTSTTTTVTTTTTVAEEDATAASETDADPEADSSPPTTETFGLSSDTEAPPVPEELTCWRVEDFGDEAVDRWRVINDGVMGGLSEGTLRFSGGVATFSGTINTNGGGFSMIRTNIFRDGATLAESLEGAEYLRIRTRSANGRGYELTLQDSTTNTAIMHFADLAVSADSAWEEPLVPLTNLDARAFGTDRPTLPAFQLSEISTLGVILADGLDGPFSIALDRIDACAAS